MPVIEEQQQQQQIHSANGKTIHKPRHHIAISPYYNQGIDDAISSHFIIDLTLFGITSRHSTWHWITHSSWLAWIYSRGCWRPWNAKDTCITIFEIENYLSRQVYLYGSVTQYQHSLVLQACLRWAQGISFLSMYMSYPYDLHCAFYIGNCSHHLHSHCWRSMCRVFQHLPIPWTTW